MGKGGTEINYPQQQSYGESLRDSLTAQIDLADELFAAEASQQYGRPAYAQLETDILKDTLLGQERFKAGGGGDVYQSPATQPATTTVTRTEPSDVTFADGSPFPESLLSKEVTYEVPNQQGQPAVHQTLAGAYLASNPEQREGMEQYYKKVQSGEVTPQELMEFGIPEEMAMRAAQMGGDEFAQMHYDYYGKEQGYAFPTQGSMKRGGGLLEMMGGKEAGYRAGTDEYGRPTQEFQGLATFGSDVAAESARRQREADIQDVKDMAPGLRSAMEAADPLGASLLSEMGTQAQEELASRGDLTPRERRMAEQAARKAWTQRGLVRDPQAVVDELSALEDAQRLRKAERRGFAQQVMGASKTMGADPFMAILGRPSGAGQQVAQSGIGTAGYGLTAGPGVVFNPEAGLSYMLGQQQNQANVAAAQAQANATRQAGMYSGLGALGGGIGQGLLNM